MGKDKSASKDKRKVKGKRKAARPNPVVGDATTGYVGVAPRPSRVVTALVWAKSGGLSLKVNDSNVVIPTPDGWVPGWVLAHPALGGASADRLLRSLVNNGTIEKRSTINASTGAPNSDYRVAR